MKIISTMNLPWQVAFVFGAKFDQLQGNNFWQKNLFMFHLLDPQKWFTSLQ